jgi:hypothetical protein
MTSAHSIMALALMKQLIARGFPAPSQAECEDILRETIDETAAVEERRQEPARG